jgi:hypothetical protein
MKNSDALLSADEALRRASGPNPLLEAIGPKVARDDFIDLIESHFVPTPTSAELALTLQQMLRIGDTARHPNGAQNQRIIYDIASLNNRDITNILWFPRHARGMVVRGITGVGKSTMIKRALSTYPQVVEHVDRAETDRLASDTEYSTVPAGPERPRDAVQDRSGIRPPVTRLALHQWRTSNCMTPSPSRQ